MLLSSLQVNDNLKEHTIERGKKKGEKVSQLEFGVSPFVYVSR